LIVKWTGGQWSASVHWYEN